MDNNRKHSRVPLQEISETPANGIYLTKEELRKYSILAGMAAFFLALLALLGRKH